MKRVLIIEDNDAIAKLIYMHLTTEGYKCICAYDGKQGADMIEKDDFDLILLDIMLPQIDGYELFEYIRPLGIPVIFITAKSAVEERIRGLRLGADDYIVKPFQIGEVLARVEAVLRRYGKAGKKISVGDVEIDLDSMLVNKGGKMVDLTVKEYELLVELVQNKNVALYRERLYQKVWGGDMDGDTRTLDAHILRLRKKLGWEERIKTVWRVGYRLEDIQ